MGVITGAMLAATLGMSSSAFAVDFSLSGTFAKDDDVKLFEFNVGTKSTVTLKTYSYAGGVQADGTVIQAGGFDPVLSLFDASGNLIFLNDDDESGTVSQDPTTDEAYDSFLKVLLEAGDYTLALTQYGNFSNTTNLADGFSQTGNENFTSHFSRCTTGSLFCDFTGDVRTNKWAFDALSILPSSEPDEKERSVIAPPVIAPDDESTQVPEPGTTMAFALVGLGAFTQRCRKK